MIYYPVISYFFLKCFICHFDEGEIKLVALIMRFLLLRIDKTIRI